MKDHNEFSIIANRRIFLKSTGAAVLGGAFPLHTVLGSPSGSSAKTLKVGLIGCGGRGTGAATQALAADPDVVLTAMGDVFADHLESSYKAIVEEQGA